MKTPRDRMVQCMRFYLSAFHAGRRSQVAKKPYNPILGETFQCYYNLPEASSATDEGQELALDGPVPWARKNQVAFIAEQVSHHPPSECPLFLQPLPPVCHFNSSSPCVFQSLHSMLRIKVNASPWMATSGPSPSS